MSSKHRKNTVTNASRVLSLVFYCLAFSTDFNSRKTLRRKISSFASDIPDTIKLSVESMIKPTARLISEIFGLLSDFWRGVVGVMIDSRKGCKTDTKRLIMGAGLDGLALPVRAPASLATAHPVRHKIDVLDFSHKKTAVVAAVPLVLLEANPVPPMLATRVIILCVVICVNASIIHHLVRQSTRGLIRFSKP